MKPSTPHFTLGLISAAALLALTACGGGGGSTDSTVATTPVTTTVMDGLIENALVCVDSNSNGVCETTETQGRTNAAGQVTLNIPTTDLSTAQLVAMVGTDAIDADTGKVMTAYTLQTPAGRHAVISPLTHMVQTKIDLDKASGTVTSIADAQTYVQTQTGLTVSVFDNFIAKRGTDDAYKKAGEVARLLVVSTQASQEAATGTTACSTLARSSRENDDNNSESDDSHGTESLIDDDLINRLDEIRGLSDDIATACSSTNSVRDCDDDYKVHALIVSTCAAPAPVAQSITFAAPAAQMIGTAAPALSATASSGLAVTFASTTPLVCSVNGSALTLLAAGTCSVTANQSGSTGYTAAAQVLRTFTVAAAPGATAQTITFTAPASQTIGTAAPALSATASSGLAVTFASTTPLVCSVNGSALTLLAAGVCTVTANQPGDTSHAAASAVSRTFNVSAPALPTAQTITFAAPANPTLGTPAPALVATSSSGLAVTFASSTPSVCTVSASTLTLVAAGACTVTASQPGNASYAGAAPVAHTLRVTAAAVVVSAANGKVVYNTTVNGSSCASCHSPMPSYNVSKVLKGANSASTILNAINGNKGGMGVLKGAYSTQQLNDMAAYLATPTI